MLPHNTHSKACKTQTHMLTEIKFHDVFQRQDAPEMARPDIATRLQEAHSALDAMDHAVASSRAARDARAVDSDKLKHRVAAFLAHCARYRVTNDSVREVG